MKSQIIFAIFIAAISANYPILIFNTDLTRNDIFLS